MKRSEKENYCFSFMSTLVSLRIIILFVSCFIINLSVIIAENNVDGFSIELIHRDSPLLNPNLTHFKREEIVFQRIGSSDLVHDIGLYLMKIQYGPVKLFQIFDTGSEILWIQCLPCVHCYSSVYQPFNPNMSSTFQLEKCHLNQTCPFSIQYQDNSSSSGVLARETIMVGTNPHRVQVENFLFGCGHENHGHFFRKKCWYYRFQP